MSNHQARTPDQVSVAPDHYLANTHEVVNQPSVLADYNLYASDSALREAVVAWR
ncbi:MAG: hypothetical protein JNK06_17830 [Candidatus Accumulibacter phosphatis]|uniref:hypothetical protein n=1 Tax=Candidatus Accumulibacter phosphatis TaxID=327160 RepID=UPI001A55E63B|nr:hypothetical protein [Candidatus Accumulibacter phosphatis]